MLYTKGEITVLTGTVPAVKSIESKVKKCNTLKKVRLLQKVQVISFFAPNTISFSRTSLECSFCHLDFVGEGSNSQEM